MTHHRNSSRALALTAGCLIWGASAAAAAPDTHTRAYAADSLSAKEQLALQLLESAARLTETASKLSDTARELIAADATKTETSMARLTAAPITAPEPPQPQKPDTLAAPAPGGHVFESPEPGVPPVYVPFVKGPSRGGSYLWVPDGKLAVIRALLDSASLSESSTALPLRERAETIREEKVIFRGDTIDMIMHERKFGRYDRKLFNYLYYPAGLWQVTLTASYGEISNSDSELLDLISDVNLSGHIFSIKPSISYTIRHNMALGLRLSYTRGHGEINSFNVDIDEDINFSLSDIGYDTESYQVGIFLTRYYGFSPRSRFAFTNELELAFASGNSDFKRPFNGEPRHTHSTSMKGALTYSPGLSVKMMPNVSFAISLGVFGLQATYERQYENGVKTGSRSGSGANFRLNIFNINFGIAATI